VSVPPVIAVERRGPVARITMCRPEVMHGAKTAADALRARRTAGSMKRMLAERDRPFAPARRKAR
jgi:hypothetical protein